MKIYFTGAILGGRINQPQYTEIVHILKQYGDVLSEHVADESISEYGETDVAKEDIYKREINRIEESDIVVAEVTTPSLGVGYLVSEAVRLNKKVIALYNGEDTVKLSAMIAGDKNVKVCKYETLEDLENIFASEIK